MCATVMTLSHCYYTLLIAKCVGMIDGMSTRIFSHSVQYIFGRTDFVSEVLSLPHTSAFSCVALRCVMMRQDIFSIFANVLFWMLRNRLAYDMI